jgi:hypothetical protein
MGTDGEVQHPGTFEVASHPYFNSECECLVVFILNTRRRVKGHYLVSIGTMDTILWSSQGGIPFSNNGECRCNHHRAQFMCRGT